MPTRSTMRHFIQQFKNRWMPRPRLHPKVGAWTNERPEIHPLEGRIYLTVEPALDILHPPYIQLGDAAITGTTYDSQTYGLTDRIDILWQTIPNPEKTGNPVDTFKVQYRKVTADTEASWTTLTNDGWSPNTNVPGVAVNVPTNEPTVAWGIPGAGRLNHTASITGLDWTSYYEYRVYQITDTTQEVLIAHDVFRTRNIGGLAAADDHSSFSFITYGDSAVMEQAGDQLEQFRRTQAQINAMDDRSDIDIEFSLMLGDNVYGEDADQDGQHYTYDRRLSPLYNPETPDFNAHHVEYFSWGNHELGQAGTSAKKHNGLPGQDNYSNPIPTNTTSEAPLTVPDAYKEHIYSFDYGDAHFISLDSNDFQNHLDNFAFSTQMDWLHNDLLASNAQWNIVFFHHPIVSATGANNYSDSVFEDIMTAMKDSNGDLMVDMVLVGHSHNYQRTKPFLTNSNGTAPVVNASAQGDANNIVKGDGLIQLLVGTGGRNAETSTSGSLLAASYGYNSTSTFQSDQEAVYGFALIDVSKEALHVRYVGNREGQVFDEFTIHASQALLEQTVDEVISYNSTWDFLDQLVNTGGDATSYPVDGESDPWYSKDFNLNQSSRGTWSSGPGPFEGGSGGGGVTGFDGMTTTNLAGVSTNPITVTTHLFRHTFNVGTPSSATEAKIEFLADDGAIFYLNGVQIHSFNMPANPTPNLNPTTTASSSVNENQFNTFFVDPSNLVQGDNLIAVELHNQSTSSSDAGFGMKMTLKYGVELISFGSGSWGYYDEHTTTPTAGWKTDVGYTHTDWTFNQTAPFGYGSIAGVGSFGTTVTNTQSGVNYYRRTFTIDDVAAYRNFTLNLRRDDQAVVFINGQEAVRSNMPPVGTPLGTQPDSREISTSEATIARFMVDPKFLKTGTNLIAVEVYQPSGEIDDDHVFDAMLTAEPLIAGEYGDFNRDGDIDASDIDQLFAEIYAYERMASINASTSTGLLEELHPHQQFRNPDTRPAFDMNRDGKVDQTDVRMLARATADFDDDGVLDKDDIMLFVAELAKSSGSRSMSYDLDGDNDVDIVDRDMLLFDLLDADFNDDDIINAADINYLVSNLISLTSTTPSELDLNGDAVITTADLDYLIRVILLTEYGDINLDGNVSIGDLTVMAEYFGTTTGMGWENGNLNIDVGVTIGDLTLLAEYFSYEGDGCSLERGDATWGLAAQALTAGVDTEFTVSEGEDVGDDLMRYLISLSVDEGVGLISGLTIQIEATDEGTLNQVNEAFGGSFTTIFEDNNLIISYDPNAAPIEQDSQFAWMTNELSMIMQNLENADIIMASFILAQATAFFETVVAQVVLAAGHTATVSGTIVAEDGTQIILDPVTFGEEE